MKKIIFVLFVFGLGSCARQNLNYQSKRDSGYPVDNTPAPAPQAYTGGTVAPQGGQNNNGNNQNYNNDNQNYNSTPQNNYNPPPQNNGQTQYVDNNGNGQTRNDYYPPQQVNYNQPGYQTFYDELGPYGSWVNYGTYGYVWLPNAGPAFTPYASNGHWVYTDYGWTWVSNYSWGWAPFHYGRWMYDDMYGWLWVPGHEWAPAWVTWGHCNGYYGWAPIGPGVNVYEGYRPPVHYWTFVPEQHITQVNVYNYRVENVTVVNNYNNITVINNSGTYAQHTYYSGPKPADVEKSTGARVTRVSVNETIKPAAGTASANQLNIYRPVINPATQTKAAPVKTVPIQNVKPVNPAGKTAITPGNPNTGKQPVNQTPIQHEAIKEQPVQRTEPVQGQPIKGQPVQREPVKEQPVQRTEPVQGQPIREQPVQREPVREQPVQRTEPVHSEPVREQPVQRTEPVQREPVREQPVQRTEPVQREPVREQPVQRTEPVQRQPVQQPVQRAEPMRQQPVNQQPRQQPRQQPKPQPKAPMKEPKK